MNPFTRTVLGLVALFTFYNCCIDDMYSGGANSERCKINGKEGATLLKEYEDGTSEEIEITSCRMIFEQYTFGCLPNGNNGNDEYRILVQLSENELPKGSWLDPGADVITLAVDTIYAGSDDFDKIKVKGSYAQNELNYAKLMGSLKPETAAALVHTGNDDTPFVFGKGTVRLPLELYWGGRKSDGLKIKLKDIGFVIQEDAPDLNYSLSGAVEIYGHETEDSTTTDVFDNKVFAVD